MPAPPFASRLLGWRGEVPNTADSASVASTGIARRILELIGVQRDDPSPPSDPGSALEVAVRDYLAEALIKLAPARIWEVERGGVVSAFQQYEHLARLQSIINADATGTLASEIGRDYLVAPDVTVGINVGETLLLLHAAVSCKWTIRSDRVQNIRHEAVILTRHRRGRQPHIVAVTAEPLPTRLASIARGTGEIDAVYHVAFEELVHATNEVGTAEQKTTLQELIVQNRLVDFNRLPHVLV